MIEVKGAKFAYAVAFVGICSYWKGNNNTVAVVTRHAYLAADSYDEALGIAGRWVKIVFPPENDWNFWNFHLIPLDFDYIEKVENPQLFSVPSPKGEK
jgi:hypothetical protein